MIRKQIGLQILNSLIRSGVEVDLINKTKEITDSFIKEFESKKVNSTKTNTDNFLEWFNNRKERYLGTKGRFQVLTPQDYKNYVKLKKYSREDFEIAIKNMFKDTWAIENDQCKPDHFLRIGNFNKYLNQNKKDKDVLKKG